MGRIVSTKTEIKSFSRLGGGLQTRAGSFQVTSSQVQSFINKTCDKNQILVVIGGSSVVFGSGMPIRYLWTKSLQNHLGSKFCVVNMASPAGPFVGYGSVAFEMSLGKFKDVLFISEASALPYFPADGFLWYKYFFWDAYYKNKLSNNYSTNYTSSQINDVVRENYETDPTNREKFEQMRLGMWLDSYLYFADLWGYIHFNKISTVYDPLIVPYNWGPLNKFADLDYEIDVEKIKSLNHYPKINSEAFNSEFDIVKSNSYKYYQKQDNEWTLNEKDLQKASKNLSKYPLTNLANKILIVSITESPYYLDHLTAEEIKRYKNIRVEELKVWRENGYHTFSETNLKAEDYGDRPHLNTLGGNKLALDIAVQVKNIFKE